MVRVFAYLVLALVATHLRADDIAYAGSSTGAFGTMDLSTGDFTLLGNSGQTLAGLAVADGSLFATSYHASNSTLYTVNTADGSLTSVGASGIDVDDFGSTTTGLYAVDTSANLYSLDPTTGAATLIGSTGLGLGSWRGLSNGSGTLYFSDGPDLYTLNTSTGAATLVGDIGGPQLGVLLQENGTLYGGQDSPSDAVDTIDPVTGAATTGPAPTSNFSGSFFGLAQNPLVAPVPEPGSAILAGASLAALAFAGRRIGKSGPRG